MVVFVAGNYLRGLQDRGVGAGGRGGVGTPKENERLLGHGGCISVKKAKFFAFQNVVVPATKIQIEY